MAQLADQSSGSPALAAMLAEHSEIERELADPAVHADQARARTLGRRYAELNQIVEVAHDLAATRDDWGAAKELASDDAGFAAEAEVLQARELELAERLQELLLPRDPDDSKDAILEIKAGEGGEESALLVICCACICASPNVPGGRPRFSTRPRATSAVTRTSAWRCGRRRRVRACTEG
jgi:protein subunit release factor A